MAFVVVYDACVLYPAPVRDLLLRIAAGGLVRARWTHRILDECFRSIAANRSDLPAAALERTRDLMCAAVPDCLVADFEGLESAVTLPDENDRHVVAAAIRCGAQAIVTYNLSDFPNDTLARFGIEAKHPDDFVLDAISLRPGAVIQAITQQSLALKSPPISVGELLDILRDRGLEQSVAQLRDLFGSAT